MPPKKPQNQLEEPPAVELEEPAAFVLVVLARDWVHDPYRAVGGLCLHSGCPTIVPREIAEDLYARYPDAFTIQK